MAMSDIDRVRFMINDKPRRVRVIILTNGYSDTFYMEQQNITNPVAYLKNEDDDDYTEVTAQVLGEQQDSIALPSVYDEGREVILIYQHTVFSNAEILMLLDAGSVRAASLMALERLMHSAKDRIKWASSNDMDYDDTAVVNQLTAMYEALSASVPKIVRVE